MYRSHFNLTEKPFRLTADPRFLWLGEKHKEALATLKYGLIDQKGFILVSGDVGTGKTTLINALLEDIDKNVLVASIKDPALNLIDFFNFIAISFNIPKKFTNKVDFIVYFSQFLHNEYSKNKCVLLIIDEVHSLSKELLEHIRLLSNIELPGDKLINIFFVGQNEIYQTLALPECRAIRQRISLAYQIKPLSESETSDYIKHRLKIAGTEIEIFTQSATKEIYRFSKGYPRLINIICDLSLLTGYSQDLKKITPAVVQECSQEYNFINNPTIGDIPLNATAQYHPETRIHYVKCPFSKDGTVTEKFTISPETGDMSSSQPATIRESSKLSQEIRSHDDECVMAPGEDRNLNQRIPRTIEPFFASGRRKWLSVLAGFVPFITRMGEWIWYRVTAAPFSWRMRKRGVYVSTAVVLALIVIIFTGFFKKEDALKSRGQKPTGSEFTAPTTSAAKTNPHIFPKTPEKSVANAPSGQSQSSPSAGIPKTLKPNPFELAKKALDHKNVPRAIELFEQAMAQNPTNVSAIKIYYSKALREQAKTILASDPYRSKKLLVKAVEADPRNAGAFFDLGMLQTKTKDYKKAIIAYQEAANLNYRSSDAYYNLGFIYASTKDYVTAEKMFLRVVDLKPSYLDRVFFNLAVVQQEQGKTQQCIENLEKAIKINPDNQRARQYLQRFKKDKKVS